MSETCPQGAARDIEEATTIGPYFYEYIHQRFKNQGVPGPE